MAWIPYAIATGVVAVIAVVGARATDVGPWYRALNNAEQQAAFLVLCAVNAVLNMAWSILFFTMRRPVWALGEVVVFWLSILALIVFIGTWNTTAALILSPYLVWVTIAGVLNSSIVRLN